MHYLSRILQQVIDCFNDVPFAQHHLVVTRHEFVLHVPSQPCDRLNAIIKQKVKQLLRNISFVCKQFAVQVFGRDFENLWILVVDVGSREYKRNDFPSVIACQMQLETMTPSHSPLSVSSKAFEHLVSITPEVVAYRYHGRVYESYAGTSAEGTEVEKEHKMKEHTAFKFDKTVVRNRLWKIGF